MPMLDFDFVYLPDGKAEFCNAHITLGVMQDDSAGYKYELSIAAQDEINQTDIAKIIEELERNRFKRMNINVAEDCKVTVTFGASAEGRSQ